MIRKSVSAPTADLPLPRELMLTLARVALNTNELRYARQLCTAWLALYPGDLQANLLYAQAFIRDKSPSLQKHALPILEKLCALDPEYLEAQEMLASVQQQAGTSNRQVAKACAIALRHHRTDKTGDCGLDAMWAKSVSEARVALANVYAGNPEQIDKAESSIHKALIENPDSPLPAITHLRTVEAKGSMLKLAMRDLAKNYHERWPDCLQFSLTLAKERLESGESSQAIEILHQLVGMDISGQVAKRLWGEHHPYESMWPASLEVSAGNPNSPQNLPIPESVASIFGWNQQSTVESRLNGTAPMESTKDGGTREHQISGYLKGALRIKQDDLEGNNPPISASSKVVQTELERMADELKRPHIAHEDGKFPVYVIFTTQAGLASQYDPPSNQAIKTQLKKLAEVTHGYKLNQELWDSLVFFADDIASTQPFGLQPAVSNDAGSLKAVISGLDLALSRRGERIGALLIVGGPEIVPFHNLPNPVEDADDEVPSDNPYSAKDHNYFISDWPVGRISGGLGNDASGLLNVLKEMVNRYDRKPIRAAWYLRLLRFFHEFWQTGVSKKLSSFGYTAAVWRRASLSVFRSIGNPNELLISPPVHACDETCQTCSENLTPAARVKGDTCLLLPDTRLAYFNLHGVPDAGEWYGQCDPALPEDGPEFPVAMRPSDIHNSGSAPQLVFTEACYGVSITGKHVDEAISLKFLASGTQAVVGSTCISYGSLSTPLTSADLLGRVFWNHLQEGFPAGESLRRAKIQLTREMNNRQGFLDAEDQKTLISFILFGDPLAQPFQVKATPKISPHLSDAAVPVRTVCERSCEGEAGSTVPLETIAHLKSIVAKYLPGMDDAQVNLYHEHQACMHLCGHCGQNNGRCSQAVSKDQIPVKSHRRIVTLSKDFQGAQHIHRQYARLTLDERGRIVKMVVSH
jgi:hypothetical protein